MKSYNPTLYNYAINGVINGFSIERNQSSPLDKPGSNYIKGTRHNNGVCDTLMKGIEKGFVLGPFSEDK